MLAIVLERRNFREFDQVITFLTHERGKVEALARGIKKITAKNSPSVEPGSLIEAELVPGKEITHFIKAQAHHIFPKVRTDFIKISYLGIILHLVSQLIKGEERDARAFELLRSFLFFMEDCDVVTSQSVASFVIKLFGILGFLPVLDRCISCDKPLLQQAVYTFDLGGGGVVCTTCLPQKRYEQQQLVANVTPGILETFKSLLRTAWVEANNLTIDGPTNKNTQGLIYRFAMYHSGQKLPDWRKVQ